MCCCCEWHSIDSKIGIVTLSKASILSLRSLHGRNAGTWESQQDAQVLLTWVCKCMPAGKARRSSCVRICAFLDPTAFFCFFVFFSSESATFSQWHLQCLPHAATYSHTVQPQTTQSLFISTSPAKTKQFTLKELFSPFCSFYCHFHPSWYEWILIWFHFIEYLLATMGFIRGLSHVSWEWFINRSGHPFCTRTLM